MDNFREQTTPAINQLLEENNIHVSLLPANTTDKLQRMDLSVNRPAKAFLKRKFEEWYCQQITDQLLDVDDEDDVELQPVDLTLGVLQELGGKWMVEMVEYICKNPQFIVNGFVKAGILAALDGEDTDDNTEDEEESDDDDEEEESDDEEKSDDEDDEESEHSEEDTD